MSESDKSGKPELSNDELTRISKEAYSRYTGYDGTAMSIGFRQGAEWATLHERSAAQARIAELEKMLEQFTYYGLIHTVNGVVPVDYDSHEDLIKKAKLIFQKQP